ncbi:hypothetical protein [Streptomyces lavendulocolor]|uniref:hypothetical protein n=1 Tax=Streptomyces lavendulocolor TaxID=67316 RepID=UPI0033C2559D
MTGWPPRATSPATAARTCRPATPPPAPCLPDLLSRDANGELLRNRGDGAGSFGATVTVATGRQHYRALF